MLAGEICDSNTAPFLIRSYQHDQGLPNNTVNAITQSHDGYLWLGTDEGLARFDGLHYRVFGLQDGLKNLQISALLEDSRHVLWIGTAGGGVGRMVAGRIKTYTVQDGLAGDSISSLLEATNGEVWIGTHTGLSRWRNDAFEPPTTNLEPMLVFGLAQDRRGDIWAATLHNGLLRFHGGSFSVADGETGIITNNPRCVFVDSQDRVWAGLREKKTLCCLDHGTWLQYGTNEGFPESDTYQLAETSDGIVWAGSWNNGLYYFSGGRFNGLHTKDGLSDDAILSLCTGRERFLWAGTQSGGLNRIGPRKLSVYHVMEGASEGQLRSLAETTNGELWAGTYGQGVYQWQGAQFEPLAGTQYRAHLLVEVMLGARDGSLWWGAGPSLYQRSGGKLVALFTDKPWLRGDRVWSLCEAGAGGLWVGTYNGKLGLLQGRIFTPQPGFSGKPITALAEEPGGALWVGSLGGGLVRLHDGKTTLFTAAKDGLPSDLVRTLRLEADGTLWIGTDGGGLGRWSQGRLTSFTTQQGLLDNTILQILEDDDGCLWLGCNQGICRVSQRVLNDVASGKSASLHALVFGTPDGMASEQCVGNSGAALKTRSGQLCFATAKGVAVIDPRHLAHLNALPAALLETVYVDQTPFADPLWQAVSDQPPTAIRIPPGRHNFEFHYTGINFDSPERIRFRYQLEGLDSGWFEAGDIRVAHYNRIPPGAWRFRVEACDASGEWNEPGAVMSFVVLAHFWQTLGFELATVGALVGLLAAGIRLVERRHYRARLKRLEQEQAMARERARIAHDLHDELGSSLTYISMSITDLGQSPENRPEALKSRAEKLSGFAVRTARALDEIVWAVNPRNDTLRSLMEYLTELARELFENTPVRCRFQIANDLPSLPLPPEWRHNLFLTAKEALNNVLKHARATELVLSARTFDQRIEIALRDDGVGFDPAAMPPPGEHNGLDNMRRRIASIGGTLVLETSPGCGTAIRLTVDYPKGQQL